MEQLRSFPETRRQSLGILLPALLGIVILTAGMAAAREGMDAPLIVGIGVIQAFLMWQFPRLTELPHENVARVCLEIIATGALAAAAFGTVEDVAVVAALAVPLIFLGEMFRPGGRENLLRQVSGTYAGGIIAIMGSLWYLIVGMNGASFGLVCTGAIAGAILVSLLLVGRARLMSIPLGALLGAFVTRLFVPDVALWPLFVLAICIGVVSWGMDQLGRAVGLRESGGVRAAFGLIPVSAMGVVGYALALIVL